MNKSLVCRVVSAILILIGATMMTSVPVSWLMKDDPSVIFKLCCSSIITIIAGSIGFWFFPRDTRISFKEGFGIVTFSWVAASSFGSIPFVWIADISIIDAFFETISGFTTTGSSILNDIEALPAGLLYWRSMTHWLGGMGIVVLSLAILPILGIGGMQLYKAEAPGPTTDQLAPRIANSAKILWLIYLLLSLTETIFLLSGGMSLFEAWCHACATVATGGFSTRQMSIKAYDSAYIDGIITVFMFLAGCNFVLHLRALRGKPLNYWKDEEFRFYFLICFFSIITIGGSLYFAGWYDKNLGTILRHASFSTLTVLTTTGYATEDFDQWPLYAKALLVCIMFIGGSGGSTSGGMKVSRFLLLFKYSLVQIRRCFYPRSLAIIRLNKQRVSEEIMGKILGFFFINVAIFVLFSLLVCVIEPALGHGEGDSDIASSFMALETAFTSVSATLYNIGPGLSQVGPTMNYAWMAPQTKLLLSLGMLIGRLEVYTVLVVFLPAFWRK